MIKYKKRKRRSGNKIDEGGNKGGGVVNFHVSLITIKQYHSFYLFQKDLIQHSILLGQLMPRD